MNSTAKKSPVLTPAPLAPSASADSKPVVAIAGADAIPAPSGAHAFQALLEERLAEKPASYPRLVRLAILLAGGGLAWAAVVIAAQLVLRALA